jgi:HK97 family phage portal protein
MFGLFKRSTPQNAPITDTYELLKSLGIGAPTASGRLVNSQVAETLPAIYCAVATIAESVASLPIHVYRKNSTGKERQNKHHAERLLNVAPNGYQTAYDFKIALMRSVLLRGNGYARIVYDGSGKAAELHLIHPDAIQMELINNRLIYKVTTKAGKFEPLLQEEVLHIRYHTDDGITGKSPVSVCRDTIGLGLSQQDYQSSQFKNGMRPTGTLETERNLDDKQYLELQNMLLKSSGTSNAGKPLILEGGLKWNQIGLTNSDAEWLASRQFSISDVGRMFKLSPIFLMDYSNSTYSNFSEASRAFLTQTLRPWLSNLQEAYSSRLISDRNRADTFIEFETKDILRATAEERFLVYDKAIKNGLMNPNECRAAENLPARTGGDEFSQSWNQNAQATPNQTD